MIHAILGSLIAGFLDRWGGGGFSFLTSPFNRGCKPARRYALPLLVWLAEPTLDRAIFCVLLGAIFSLNLDEIEDRNWDEIFLYAISLGACLWTVAGWYSFIPGAWWLIGIYLSNFGIAGKKLDWKYVELIRGSLIGLVISI